MWQLFILALSDAFHSINRAVSRLFKTLGALLTRGINIHKSNGVNLTFRCSSVVG